MSDTRRSLNTLDDIEFAVRRIDELEAKLAACEKYRDAYAEMGRIGTEAYRELEAKLTKAVEAMEFWEQALEPDIDEAIDLMQTTLAELKETPDA